MATIRIEGTFEADAFKAIASSIEKQTAPLKQEISRFTESINKALEPMKSVFEKLAAASHKYLKKSFNWFKSKLANSLAFESLNLQKPFELKYFEPLFSRQYFSDCLKSHAPPAKRFCIAGCFSI